MHVYEIRVLRENHTASRLVERMYPNDHEAIEVAQKMAEGRAFEVWRGLNCICDARAAPTPNPQRREQSDNPTP